MDKAHICTFTPAKGQAIARFIFAHGAGASMDSDFMADMANRLAEHQIEVMRFNFDYMQMMSETGKRRPPTRMPKLLLEYQEKIEQFNTELPLFIGGKSMGGRAASMLAAQQTTQPTIKGVIVLGYPFHPSGKPDKLRVEHLSDLPVNCLILQGERDALGNQSEIEQYDLPDEVKVVFLADGDHSLKPRKASGFSLDVHLNEAAVQINAFIRQNMEDV